MPSLMTEEFGISHRQLQILALLWQAGEPISRRELLARFHERYGDPIEDASLRSHLRKMDERGLLVHQLAPREPGTPGRSPTLYSAKPRPRETIEALLSTIFGDILSDDPELVRIALQQLERRLQRAAGDRS